MRWASLTLRGVHNIYQESAEIILFAFDRGATGALPLSQKTPESFQGCSREGGQEGASQVQGCIEGSVRREWGKHSSFGDPCILGSGQLKGGVPGLQQAEVFVGSPLILGGGGVSPQGFQLT